MKDYNEHTMELLKKMKTDKYQSLLYRNKIVEYNLRLVAHVLKKYRPYTDDQYQAGCMGLILAVDTFDEERGIPFANYACFCIEREIHKQHRYQSTLIENILAHNLIYLQAEVTLGNGDVVTQADIIADEMSEEELNRVLDENDLRAFFEDIVICSINEIANNTKGQTTKLNLDQWKDLEIRYILELAQVESQKIRFNFSQMAKALGISVQNTRNRHLRVIELIKRKCRERGYKID